MRRPNLTMEQKEFAATKREAGWSHARIARQLGVSPGSVAWHCLKVAADPPKAKPIDATMRGPALYDRNGKPVRRFTPEEDQQILTMRLAGKTPTQIGRALKRRHNSIVGRLMTLARHEARLERAQERAA
jgi:hypothetical protein